MHYSTLLLALLPVTGLCAQVGIGSSLAHVEILHEEHFPRPPFVICFEKNQPQSSTLATNALENLPVFYIAVGQVASETASENHQYPVVIYDTYEGLSEEVGVEKFPMTLIVGENYVVQKILTSASDDRCAHLEPYSAST